MGTVNHPTFDYSWFIYFKYAYDELSVMIHSRSGTITSTGFPPPGGIVPGTRWGEVALFGQCFSQIWNVLGETHCGWKRNLAPPCHLGWLKHVEPL